MWYSIFRRMKNNSVQQILFIEQLYASRYLRLKIVQTIYVNQNQRKLSKYDIFLNIKVWKHTFHCYWSKRRIHMALQYNISNCYRIAFFYKFYNAATNHIFHLLFIFYFFTFNFQSSYTMVFSQITSIPSLFTTFLL